MGIISDFVLASPEDALLYYQYVVITEGSLPAAFERAEYKNYPPPQLDMLWAILRHERWTPDRHRFEHICHEADGFRALERFPNDFVGLLAGLDDAAMGGAIHAWMAAAELRGTAEDHRRPLDDLRRLASRAVHEGKGLYLYLSL
jgi:hypothetical protein